MTVRSSWRRAAAALALLCPAAGLAGCSWFDSGKPPTIPGTRIAVLTGSDAIDVDSTLQDTKVRLPHPVRNPDWAQQGGGASHSNQHLELADAPARVWTARVGDGSGSGQFLLAQPVVAGGRVYTIDAAGAVSAFDAATGRQQWHVDTVGDDETMPVAPGGVAAAGGKLFVANGLSRVTALAADSGAELWRQTLPAPARSAPTVVGERVYVVTQDNLLQALSVQDGRKLWSHQGLAETVGLLGGASPAADPNVVIAPYSSGELFALRADTGRLAWADSLNAVRRSDAISALADIHAPPVLDRGLVIADSQSGRVVGIDLRSGTRVWDHDFGGTEMPWVAGDWVYLVTGTMQVLCMDRTTGGVRWRTALPRYANPDKKTGPISWVGPALAGDRLIVLGSSGEALSISPYSGDVLSHLKLSDKALVPPVIADGTLYILTDDGTLSAYR